jgi:DNA-binding XRE family transcriptional regulator
MIDRDSIELESIKIAKEKLEKEIDTIMKEKISIFKEALQESLEDQKVQTLIKDLGDYDEAERKRFVEQEHLLKNSKIENRIKYFVDKSQYNQSQIAEIIGISPKTLSNMISNRFSTSLDVGLKLSILFGVSVNEIFKLVPQDDDKNIQENR